MKVHRFQTPGTSPAWPRRGLVLGSLFVLSLAVTNSYAQPIYKWEDARGILHYSATPETRQAKLLQTDTLPSFNSDSPPAPSAAEEPVESTAALATTALPAYSELATETVPLYNDLVVENERLVRFMANVVTTGPEVGEAPQPLPILAWPQGWLEGSRQWWLTGGVYNLGQGTCENPTVEVAVFDDTGVVVGSFETAAGEDALQWEEEARFESQGVTPVGESLSWEATPRCNNTDGVIDGPRQRGTLTLVGGSRVWWGQRYRTQ